MSIKNFFSPDSSDYFIKQLRITVELERMQL